MTPLANLQSRRRTRRHAASIEWKGAIWRSVRSDLTLKDLLTTLKGFGPMEAIEFVKHGHCRGRMSLGINAEGTKEVTVFELVVHGEKCRGKGREALVWLRKAFDARLYAQDLGFGRVREGPEEALPFWIKMFREGILTEVEGELCHLHQGMSESQIDAMEAEVKSLIAGWEAVSTGNEGQR